MLRFVLVLAAGFAVFSPAGSSAAPAASGSNLLRNPGFEQPTAGHPWMPAAWDTFEAGLSTVFFARDTFLAHEGRYTVSVANVSKLIPMWHNWSQTLVVGRETWGKDAVFTLWTRNNGVDGRGYILLQAYRDTVEKMARTWKVSRDSAMAQMGITPTSQGIVNLGWKREYFSDHETDWVRRQVRVFVPVGTNILIVRGGLLGTGQVLFDDATLVLEAARPSPPLPLNQNLLADPGFEGDGDDWEYSLPPYEGLRADRDTTEFHGGKASVRFMGGVGGIITTRAGVCQILSNRNLSGKRVRASAWVRTDSLFAPAYVMVYSTTVDGDVVNSSPRQFGGDTPWTKAEIEVDTPPGTIQVSAWFLYNAPGRGELRYDDCAFEVVGEAEYIKKGLPPPKPANLFTH